MRHDASAEAIHHNVELLTKAGHTLKRERAEAEKEKPMENPVSLISQMRHDASPEAVDYNMNLLTSAGHTKVQALAVTKWALDRAIRREKAQAAAAQKAAK